MELHKSWVTSLRSPTDFNKRWLQDEIVKNPAVLGLGDLVVRSQDRAQPQGGRLDLPLEDLESLSSSVHRLAYLS